MNPLPPAGAQSPAADGPAQSGASSGASQSAAPALPPAGGGTASSGGAFQPAAQSGAFQPAAPSGAFQPAAPYDITQLQDDRALDQRRPAGVGAAALVRLAFSADDVHAALRADTCSSKRMHDILASCRALLATEGQNRIDLTDGHRECAVVTWKAYMCGQRHVSDAPHRPTHRYTVPCVTLAHTPEARLRWARVLSAASPAARVSRCHRAWRLGVHDRVHKRMGTQLDRNRSSNGHGPRLG